MESCEFLSENIYSVGRVVVDKSFHTQSADEKFFSYFGNDVIYSIRRTICDEDFPRISECLEISAQGGVRRTVIRMKGLSGELRWIMASVKMLPENNGGEPLYSISFSDIFSLEAIAFSS